MMSKQEITPMSKDYNHIIEEEFLPHLKALFNFAYNLTYNEPDANDLVQETFLKACKSVATYQENTNAKAWLFKILKNIFINEYRKKKRRPTGISTDDMIEGSKNGPIKNVDLREELFMDMLGDEISIAINSLPVDFKTVVLLYDIERFSYKEMAQILDIPEGTVRSRLHRARKDLKKKLSAYAKKRGYGKNKTNSNDEQPQDD